MTDELEARMNAAVQAARQRIETCHERVACPRCHAPIGQKCRRRHRGGVRLAGNPGPQPELKHPHRERWTLVQPAR